MAVQLHCAENVANIFTLLPPSHLSFSRSCLFPFCLSKEHIACCSLSGCHSTKSGRPLARCSRYMVSERLAETPKWPCDGVSGCLMTDYKRGSSFWVSSIISQLPPSSWTDSFENTRMFVLEAPVISFNPKAFFFSLYDELFRQCFPKLSSTRTDPERTCATTPTRAPKGIGVFWLQEVPEERIQSQGLSSSRQ